MYKSRTPTKEAREKALFRKSARWQRFKVEMKGRSCGLDKVTGRPLNKGWNLHHCDLNPKHYESLDPNNFECLNAQTHDFVHWFYRYYQKDPMIIDRLEEVMKKMVCLNAPKCDSLIITPDYELQCGAYDYPCRCDNCIKGTKNK